MSFLPSFSIKWNGQKLEVNELTDSATVLQLKNTLYEKTRVLPERQKLMGLKHNGKPAGDEVLLKDLGLKEGVKIMMVGTPEAEIEKVKVVVECPEVVDDFDIEEDIIEVQNRKEYLDKIEKRISTYDLKILNPIRPNKKLLVLDIDYTLFDHKSVGETGNDLMRPYLHEFLTKAYVHYEIVIWSATSMKWITAKMEELGVMTNPLYKICFMVDSLAMITVDVPTYGVIEVKPLGVIWGKFPEWGPKNTIMFDDLRRNFIMNPQSGLKIKPYKNAYVNRTRDRELKKLSKYLDCIASLEDLTPLDHKYWEKYYRRARKRTLESVGGVDNDSGDADEIGD